MSSICWFNHTSGTCWSACWSLSTSQNLRLENLTALQEVLPTYRGIPNGVLEPPHTFRWWLSEAFISRIPPHTVTTQDWKRYIQGIIIHSF